MAGEIKQVGEIKAFGKLGREIKISPKSLVKLSNDTELKCPDAMVLEIEIGTGKGYLVMPADTWAELKNDCPVMMKTYEEYKKMIK